jgi:hypothetical protein
MARGFPRRRQHCPKATISARRAAFALALYKKGLEPSSSRPSPKVPAAANWLASNDPNFEAEKRKRERMRAKAKAQAKANRAVVARYVRAMHLA